MFRNIALSSKPIDELVEFAMKSKGAEARPDTVKRYSQMLETSIRIDSGERIESELTDYINSLSGESRFEALVYELGTALNASKEEVSQFLTITDAVSEVASGGIVDEVEARLMSDFGAKESQLDDSPYAHLDQETADLWSQEASVNNTHAELDHGDASSQN